MSRLLKVACVFEDALNPYLFQFDQGSKVAAVVEEICLYARKSDSEKYGLKADQGAGLWSYVTSENVHLLKDGSVLKLCSSPEVAADDICKQLSNWGSKGGQQTDVLQRLESEAYDGTFSILFAEKGGIKLLKTIIDQFLAKKDEGSLLHLGHGLSAFYRLLCHKTKVAKKADANPWKEYPATFYNDVIGYMSMKGSMPATVIRSTLQIAGAYVIYTPEQQGFASIYKQGKGLKGIAEHIPTKDAIIQEAAVMLINALISKASDTEKPALFSKLEKLEVKKTLGSNLASMKDVPTSLAHELYVLQTNLLNTLAGRAAYDYTPHDKDLVEKLAQLREPLVDVLEGGDGDFVTYLGFTNKASPEDDFKGYPGVLALDNMSYFAMYYPDEYKKLVLDQRNKQEDYICPFILTGKKLSVLLLDILDVGKTVDDNSTQYLPLFYQARGTAFEELFGVGVQLLHKTWSEMEAKVVDMDKVIGVVRVQLLTILSTSSHTGSAETSNAAIQGLKKMVERQTYDEVRASYMQRDEESYNRQLTSDALISLKAHKRDQYQEVVKQQRYAYMMDGAYFSAIKAKGRDTTRFFARLSPNSKEIRWGDPIDASQVDPQSSPVNLPYSKEVESLVWFEVGPEVPAVKSLKMGKKVIDEHRRLMFAFNRDQEEWVTFIAEDRLTASIWMDGIRMLMGRRALEPETRTDIETLVDAEMNLVLLNLHGVQLPQSEPEIPSPPANLNFVLPESHQSVA